ncbi:MAG: lipopolysaccharide core biosynthesis protein [Mucilaginibacter sp.]|nr:lipopolysaccharide core biosynthesis protein [Mucilaginibacter sp.]
MQNKSRNLFRLSRFVLLKLPVLFKVFSKFRFNQKRLLLIKTDAIGDYILFRNYLEVLKKTEKYNDYHITLLGNKLWEELALKYDHEFANDFIFIDPETLYYAPLKLLKLGWRLFKNNYEIVLQPSYTRLLITDGLAALTAAKNIIGFEGDNEGILPRYKTRTDNFYTQKLILPINILFEFERSGFFFQEILDCKVSLFSSSLSFNKTEEIGIVVFPGAGSLKRAWEAEKFRALITLIKQHTLQPVYLVGNDGEIHLGQYLTESLPANSVINLIGKTSVIQLTAIIGNAALVIANETSAIHIAAATQTKSVCILGGGHFGRFAPYPVYFANKPLCVYEKMDCYYCNWNCKFLTRENEPHPCIGCVGLEAVWQSVRQLL